MMNLLRVRSIIITWVFVGDSEACEFVALDTIPHVKFCFENPEQELSHYGN